MDRFIMNTKEVRYIPLQFCYQKFELRSFPIFSWNKRAVLVGRSCVMVRDTLYHSTEVKFTISV